MLPKNRRIPRKMFPLLSKGAKIFRNEVFFLKLVPTSGESRFCFSVSKKTAKDAVVRNRLRRAGYRLLEKSIKKVQLNSMAMFSFRVVPKNENEIDDKLKSILKESKLIK